MAIGASQGRSLVQTDCQPAIDKPARYCIRVVGYLDEQRSTYLGGLKIDSPDQEGKTTVTTLSGTVIDQAALYGVLKALYDMRLLLISVQCLDVS